jgi:hypothetical protein
VEIGSVDDRKVIALPKNHSIAEAGSHRFYKWGLVHRLLDYLLVIFILEILLFWRIINF